MVVFKNILRFLILLSFFSDRQQDIYILILCSWCFLIFYFKTFLIETSGQNGGIGRLASPPHRAMRRITTNLKTKNSQNCQKNQTLWKSDNQEFIGTFMQMGRRGGEDVVQCGMKDSCSSGPQNGWSHVNVWSHINV